MRELNRESFATLIARLDADPQRAGEQYEGLRRRLLVFFEGRQCGWESEELADATLDLVAAKLNEGLELYGDATLSSYTYGIARNVWKDRLKRKRPEPLKADAADRPAPEIADARALSCLDSCLEELPPETRTLILEFYRGERRIKLDNRRRLAEELHISANLLSQRTRGIRQRLEKCVNKCVGEYK